MAMNSRPTLRVGIIGCGEIAQVAHVNILNTLSDRFGINHLCDVSQQALEHCAAKIPGRPPKTTTRPAELCASPEVDAVIVCSATPLHVAHAIASLEHDKHVFVEKPLALCYRDIDALAAAEAKSKGNVFVGYMRRYTPALQSAIDEIAGAEIQYARVRDIIGPNTDFVAQSGTFPLRFADVPQQDSDELAAVDADVKRQALETEFKVGHNESTTKFLDLLGGLGTHDLSVMRELLGMPERVLCASFKGTFWTATFDYGGFVVSYESGINDVPVFDAHVEVYTQRKIVKIEYDTPYIKGLPTTMTVREKVERPHAPSAYQERQVRSTYEDSYTIELREWYECIMQGKRPKTTIEDARQDIDLIRMILQAA